MREPRAPYADIGSMIGASVAGMQVAGLRFDAAAERIAIAGGAGPAAGIDLAEEMPELVVASAAYGANAAALRTQDETTGFLLDVLAR